MFLFVHILETRSPAIMGRSVQLTTITIRLRVQHITLLIRDALAVCVRVRLRLMFRK